MIHRANNFDALRLMAAFSVLVNHSMALTGNPGISFCGQSMSTVGVKVFFAISGYLIATSWQNDPDPWRFLLRRARRVMPALALVVLFSVLVLGVIFTPLPLRAYITHGQVLRYLGNIIFYPSYSLPLVFATNIYPNAVNGSLWTLPVEVAMYAMTPLFVFAARRRRIWIAALFTLAVALNLVFNLFHPWLVVAGTEFWSAASLAPYFVAGAAIAACRLEALLNWPTGLAVVLLLHFVSAFASPWSEILLCMALPYATVAVGLCSWRGARQAGRWGDFSYGIYLWAFPMQQTAVALFGAPAGGWGNVALVLPAVLLMAALSFYLVEKPALARKIAKPDQRRPGAALGWAAFYHAVRSILS